MRTRVARFALCLTLGMPLAVGGQQPPQVDPVTVSPDKFTVLLENEHVRVIEYVLRPGERDQWHTHPPKVSYVLAGGTLRITTDDGKSFLSEGKSGSASWMKGLGRHYAQNVGQIPVRILLVEVKVAANHGLLPTGPVRSADGRFVTVDDAEDAEAKPPTIHVVENWYEEFRNRERD